MTQVFTANATADRSRRGLIVAGPLVVAVGLASYGALQQAGPSGPLIAWWFVTLFIAGAGIGLGFPHLTVAALGSTSGEEEGAKAAAAINTVFIIASAVSAALAGVLVNLGAPDLVRSARVLMSTFAAISVIGLLFARRAAAGVR